MTIRGALAAICLATICQQIVVLVGTSLSVTIPLVIALAAGWTMGLTVHRRSLSATAATERALLCLALLAWMIATPWLLQGTDWVIARPRVLEPSAGHNSLVMLVLCLGLAGIPAAMVARLAAGLATGGRAHSGWQLIGAAGGLAAWGLGLAQLLGPWSCGVAAAGLGLAIAIRELLRPADGMAENASGSVASALAAACTTGDATGADQSRIGGWLRICLEGGLAIGCGGLLAALGRALEQLQPGTIYLACADAIGVLLGLGVGTLGARSRWGGGLMSDRNRLLACGGLAGWSVALLA
ncbi:MAG TPA: hypothetical protein VL475_08015, partial [Planctomycetaceae bacterium]|nr:hypothetical protein [Planctomycetaceae bacterium]